MPVETNLESCVDFVFLQISWYRVEYEIPEYSTTLGEDSVHFPGGFHFIVELDLSKIKQTRFHQ